MYIYAGDSLLARAKLKQRNFTATFGLIIVVGNMSMQQTYHCHLKVEGYFALLNIRKVSIITAIWKCWVFGRKIHESRIQATIAKSIC